MDYAYTIENKLISAYEAFVNLDYECPVCRGRLTFHPGIKNKPHFRHKKDVPEEIKQFCEEYVPSFPKFNYFEQEELENKQLRMVITPVDGKYCFSLRLPLIDRKHTSRVIYDDLYFNYNFEELGGLIVNTKRLLSTINESLVTVPLKTCYTLVCDNSKLEKLLNLQISGTYQPFENGPLLFKNIQGEYRSINYRQLTLVGRFMIMSKRLLSNIPKSIEEISKTEINGLYLYDLIMPEVLDEGLIDWFSKKLSYTIFPGTSYIELLEPVRFKKIGFTYEVNSDECTLLYLDSKSKKESLPAICIKSPLGSMNRIRPSNDGTFSLKLEVGGDYNLVVEAGTSEFYTIRKVNEISYTFINSKYFEVNNENCFLESKRFEGDFVEVATNMPFNYYSLTEICYGYKSGGNHKIAAPAIIHLPRIGKFELSNFVEETLLKVIHWDLVLQVFLNAQRYPKRVYDTYLMNEFMAILQKSEYRHKAFLLSLIRKYSVHIPEPIMSELEKMR